MAIVKLIIGVIIGLIAITIVAEAIEFLLVRSLSGIPSSVLQYNQELYFNVRNTHWVLGLKFAYSILAGYVGGYLVTWINLNSGKVKYAIYTLIGIQLVSLIWAGFFSELSNTGPYWMWLYLILVIPGGIWLGYRRRITK